MACPATAKGSILPVDEAIKVLNDPRAEKLRIFIVVNNPTDARRIVEAVPSVPLVNISNYGHLGNDVNQRIKITETVFVTQEDLEDFARIEKTGIKCQYQVVPDNTPQDVYDLIRHATKEAQA